MSVIDLTLESGQTVDLTLEPLAEDVTITVSTPSPPGPQGPEGDSAYEVAVENGFVGTEAEWIVLLTRPMSYIHVQGAPSAVWVIEHNLGYYPAVTIIDSADSVVIGAIEYDSINQVTAVFSGAFSGQAFLS